MANAIPPLERGLNGENVILGFLDTRFDGTSGELFDAPSLSHLMDGRATWRDFTEADQEFHGSNQRSRHGLSVASVAVGYAPGFLIGPAHGATVYAATTEFEHHERNSEEDNLVAALEWMESEGVDVVNISLGYRQFDTGQHSYSPIDFDGDTGLTTIAADRAVMLGVVVVSSAGNSGADIFEPKTIGMPADGDSVIAVGGVEATGRRSTFSSLGPTSDNRIKPDVAAQATSVFLAVHEVGYAFFNGTSFSSPMVAAVVCQILQANPELNPMEVLQLLRSTASQENSPDNFLGWGIVDADAATIKATTPVSIEPEINAIEGPTFGSPHPNPALRWTILPIRTNRKLNHAEVQVYDTLGRLVARPYSGPLEAGKADITLDTSGLAPGAYHYVINGYGRPHSGTFMVGR